MKIAVLSYEDVSSFYTATLVERGHEVTISSGGAIHAAGLKPYLECDGCLLLARNRSCSKLLITWKHPARRSGAISPTFRLRH